jgi:hypothetical protein
LIKAEKAAVKARLKVAAMMNVGKKAERKVRDHALYNAVGLVDTKTDLPTLDRGKLFN